MTRLRLTLFALILFATAPGQAPFMRNYALSGPTLFTGSTLTPDGGLMICGTRSPGPDSVGVLMRLNGSGDLLWAREFHGGKSYDIGTGSLYSSHPLSGFADVAMGSDSTYIGVGAVRNPLQPYPLSYYAIRFDGSGDTLRSWWGEILGQQRGFSQVTPGVERSYLIFGAVGGIFVNGHSSRYHPDSVEMQNGYLIAAGGMSRVTDACATMDHGAVFSGSGDNGQYVSKLDSTGVMQWIIGINPGGWVSEAPDGSIYLASGGPELTLLHLDPNGSALGGQVFQFNEDVQVQDLSVRDDGKIIAVGTGIPAMSDSTFAFMAQIDQGGTLDHAWRYDAQPGDTLSVSDIEVLPGMAGSYLIGAAGVGRPMLMRIDSLGNSAACQQTPLTAAVSAATWTVHAQWDTTASELSFLNHPLGHRFIPNDTTVYSLNATGCGPQPQLYTATGTTYFDTDADSVFDANEAGLPWYPISFSPFTGIGFSNGAGVYDLVTDVADAYTIAPAPPQQWWVLSSDSAAYHPSFTPQDTLFQGLDFGYAVVLDTTILEGTTIGGSRCFNDFRHWLRVRNFGSTAPEGMASYTFDTSVQFQSSLPPADSIVGQTAYWHFDSLWFGATLNIDAYFELIPGTWQIGDTLTWAMQVLADDGFGNLLPEDASMRSTGITCAFDPNTKEVSPSGPVPFDQDWLTYTINFQNTGTDTAFTVRIEDQLSQHLQWNTLQYRGSSHELTGLSIGALGKAEFTFENILLPDSNVNEPASHGFVAYRIAPVPGLPHLTPIENNAGIFFDLNAPVVTNTVVNQMINCATATPWPIWVMNVGNDLFAGTGVADTLRYTYQWYLDGLPIAGATGIFNGGGQAWWPASASGDYSVELVDEFGCTSLSDVFTHILTALEANEHIQFRVAPNPFNESTRLLSNAPIAPSMRIELIDLHGRVVRMLQGNGTREVVIERGELASGMYSARAKDAHGPTGQVRLVVQ